MAVETMEVYYGSTGVIMRTTGPVKTRLLLFRKVMHSIFSQTVGRGFRGSEGLGSQAVTPDFVSKGVSSSMTVFLLVFILFFNGFSSFEKNSQSKKNRKYCIIELEVSGLVQSVDSLHLHSRDKKDTYKITYLSVHLSFTLGCNDYKDRLIKRHQENRIFIYLK